MVKALIDLGGDIDQESYDSAQGSDMDGFESLAFDQLGVWFVDN